ncbi:COG complex component [Gonapodya prolifera JEL478]|uniref:Conserved oligomeric Golgi complex subunit 2 n=1 Tax=Gonapodya prolifera (strain JEL478) TaxID=1344416 RepID=A0A139ADI7_GONPJ|nr:COG complex component [Gonapodya prolifera JEL478]|eukprot:KXS14654.1 COG complex component [Gonapodya prolifera JEL478]
MFPLEILSRELTSFQALLRSDMMDLINRNSADFINLSTNLIGVDSIIENVRGPAEQKLRGSVTDVRDLIQDSVDQMNTKLEKLGQLRERKALLELFIGIHDALVKVEGLLADISQNFSSTTDSGEAGVARDVPSPDMKLLERVAIEYNQLRYSVERAQGLPFVENLSERIATATESLESILSTMLSGLLLASSDLPEGADNAESVALTQCMRIFTGIQRSALAEQVVRETLVKPCITTTLSPTTPDISSEQLNDLFHTALKTLQRKCGKIIQISVNVKDADCHIVAHSIFPEVCSAIERHMPQIFMPGIADTFHKNYTATMRFIIDLESLAPSLAEVVYLRQQPYYTDLMKKWQLPVYFQLRFSHISAELENSLAKDALEDPTNFTSRISDGSKLSIPSSRCVVDLVRYCWSGDVWLHILSARFWRLTLQITSRYSTWLEKDFLGNQSESLWSLAIGFRRWIVATRDLDALDGLLRECFSDVIRGRLPPSVTSKSSLEADLLQTLDPARQALTSIGQRLKERTVDASFEAVKQIRNVPGLFRKTNKEPPTKPSPYVSQMFRVILDLSSPYETELSPMVTAWRTDTVLEVTRRYRAAAEELLTTIRKTEESLKRLKRSLKKSQPGEDEAGNMTDEDKIRMQIALDAQAFAHELEQFGILPQDHEEYQELLRVVKI